MPFPKYFAVTKRYDENFYKELLRCVELNPGIRMNDATTYMKVKVGSANRGVIYNALEALLYLGKLRAEVIHGKKGRPAKKYYIDKPDMSWSDILLKNKKPKIEEKFEE